MTISELINSISALSQTTGLSATAMIFICFVLVLILTSGFAILLQLRNTGNVLIDADRELEELAQTFGQPLPAQHLPETFPYMAKPDPEAVGFSDTRSRNGDTRKSGMEAE